jgi:hypothetical protein
MMDFEKELASILEDDPLGLLVVKPKATPGMSADAKLRDSFEEINAFVREHGHEPEKNRNIKERQLHSRLKGIRENPEKVVALAEYDSFDLFAGVTTQEPKEVYDVADVLGGDPLGLLGDDGEGNDQEENIFNLTHVPKSADKPDFVARRKKCVEFKQFEPLFKKVHADLASGDKKMRSFISEKYIVKGAFFLVQGMLVYVANKGEKEKKNFGNVNARLYCVFENGTESNMLMRSLAAALWKDESSRHIIDACQVEMFEKPGEVGVEDKATGCIYILKSLSDDPQIKEIEDLYKIGFSSGPVQERIQNAAQDPTYLMADVKLVTEYQTFNLNPQKMELLLHTFFAKSCLNLDVYDGEGKRHVPREWFVVPLHILEAGVHLLISGEIVYYRYDHEGQEIVAL